VFFGQYRREGLLVESGENMSAWSFSNISVMQSIPLRCVVRHLGESDSLHLWTQSKMAENRKKIVLTENKS
jgi:hypothetical protein